MHAGQPERTSIFECHIREVSPEVKKFNLSVPLLLENMNNYVS